MDAYRVFVDLKFTMDDDRHVSAQQDRILVGLSNRGLRPAISTLPGGRVRIALSVKAERPSDAGSVAWEEVEDIVGEVLGELSEDMFASGYSVDVAGAAAL